MGEGKGEGEKVAHGLPLTFILSPKGRGKESSDGSGPSLVRTSVTAYSPETRLATSDWRLES